MVQKRLGVVGLLLGMASLALACNAPINLTTPAPPAQMIQTAVPGLTSEQADQILENARDDGFVTQDELAELGLNAKQIGEVAAMLGDLGLINATQSAGIAVGVSGTVFYQESTKVAEYAVFATQTVDAGTCYVTAAKNISSVNIRRGPSTATDAIGYLTQSGQLKVIGHNNAPNDVDLWWQVEFNQNEELLSGWVAANAVKTIHQVGCQRVRGQ